MKKLLTALLTLFVSSSVLANVTTKDITNTSKMKEVASASWYTTSAADIFYVNNFTDSVISVFINVAAENGMTDVTTISCAKKTIDLNPGSSVVCDLYSGERAAIHVKPENFKTGSRGSYSIIH